jgi:hypothetical protein
MLLAQVKSRTHPGHDVVVALMFSNGEQMSLFLDPAMAARLGRETALNTAVAL